jgi:tetratricopeptide (TPR) repeat protein
MVPALLWWRSLRAADRSPLVKKRRAAVASSFRAWSERWGSLFCCAALLSLLSPPVFPAINDSTDHAERAVALILQGDLQGAEKEARLALSSSSTRPLAYATLGSIRFQQKKLDASRQYLEKAIQLNPHLLGARLTLGQVYALQGRTRWARQMFQQALRMDPDNPLARMNLAQLEASVGHYQASLELVEPVAGALRGSADGLLVLLVTNLGLGRKDTARALVADWLALGESVPPPLAIEFAKSLADHGLAAEAAQVLEKAKGSDPGSFELAFALGGAYLASGDLKRASECYEQAANLNERCVLCFRQIAKIAERERETEKALAYLIKAKLLEPDNPEVLFDFGRVCLERNLFRDAIPALEKASRLRPNDDRYTYVLASAYGMKLHFKEAVALFDQLLNKKPEDPILNYALGSVLYMEGKDLDGAEKYLRKSISLQPDQLGAYYYLGMVVFKKGDQDQAGEIFHELLQRHPDQLASLEQLGRILVKQRKNEEAEEVLQKVLRLNPDSLIGHYQYGLLLFRLGKKEESAKHMQLAQQLEEARKKESKMEFYLLNPH